MDIDPVKSRSKLTKGLNQQMSDLNTGWTGLNRSKPHSLFITIWFR